MPGRYSMRRRRIGPIVTSIKNVFNIQTGITSANTVAILAKAVNSPSSTVTSDVSNGCIVKAIWVNFDVCGLAGTGVLNVFDAYLMKNPGDNLTGPGAASVGSSNEKKFVIRKWRSMIMRNQDGNNPYHWEGWVRIPKRYHRMGTDDTWKFEVACSAGVTGNMSAEFIYKWYR